MRSNTSHAAATAAAVPSQADKSPLYPAAPVEYAEAFTIQQFIRAHAISRQTLYNLWAKKVGPDFFLVGTHRRISREAARAWRERSKP